MKLNELKNPIKEALDWSPLLGHYGQSFMGDNPAGMDREGIMAKNIFVRNFLQKAISGLDAAINSGLVDPQAPLAGATPAQATPAQAASETPAQAAERTRIEKQKQAGATAQSNMAANPPPVSQPVASTKKPWKGSGPRPPGLATKMQRGGFRESSAFSKLDYILESIININEDGESKQSVSQYIQSLFRDYMHGVPITNPNTFTQLKSLSDQVQATYAKDKGKAALTKLADLGWAVSHSPEAMAKKDAQSADNTSANSADAAVTAAPGTSTATAAEPTASPEAAATSKIGVRQINKIIPTLRKRDLVSVKKNVDNTLNSRGGATTTAATSATAPTDTGASAFGQMSNTLSGANTSKSSTGGTTTKTATGTVHTAKPITTKPKVAKPKVATPAKDNIISMPKGRAGKVRAAREGGVTPEEQAKFDEKVRQAMANQKS